MTTRRETRRRRQLQLELGGRLTAVTADVSAAGFSAEMTGVFLPGAALSGTAEVDGRPLGFSGEVVWADPGEPRRPSRIGVRFTRVEPALRDDLDVAGH